MIRQQCPGHIPGKGRNVYKCQKVKKKYIGRTARISRRLEGRVGVGIRKAGEIGKAKVIENQINYIKIIYSENNWESSKSIYRTLF